MNFRISILAKLLLFIIPLACIPLTVVGYFSIEASVERVNRLVRQEQMVQVEASAQKINQVFHNCKIDLETITRLPVLEDFRLARLFRLQAEAEFNRDNLVKLFQDILARNVCYHSIRFVELKGWELIRVGRRGPESKLSNLDSDDFFHEALRTPPQDNYFSLLTKSREWGGQVMHAARPFYYGGRELAGLVVIDLDFEKISKMVRAIHLGEKGYSFLADQRGLAMVHPSLPPYGNPLALNPHPSIARLIKRLTAGETGWEDYIFEGEPKMAAFAPIPAMKWSLAVTIPLEEVGQEAQAIKAKVVQAVAVTLLVTLLGVSIISYSLLRPVRRLVAATDRLARGDLDQEIPVQSRDELGDLTRSFNRMVRNLARIQRELVLSEKLISLGRLSAGVAHEIRNPLNAMKGAMVHLKQRWANEPLIQQYTSLVCEEIDRLNRVVSEILYFSKQSLPKLERVDLNRFILETQQLLSAEADRGQVRFVNRLDEALPPVWLDAHQIEQVLINLVINALDAMNGSGQITFTTSLLGNPPRKVRITVEDNGAGIRGEDLDNVLDPFFTTKEDGTGLGLPLSLGIVEAHGGELTIESQVGVGTKVSITLTLGGPRE